MPFGYRLVREDDVHVLPRTFYAPVPDPEELTPEDWDRKSPLRGIALDTRSQLAFLRETLAPLWQGWDPPEHGEAGTGEFFWRNRNYQEGDAEVLYAMLRHLRPRRVVELGSGFTTLAACAALEGQPQLEAYDVFDPFPRGHVPPGAALPTAVHEVRAQDVPESALTSLSSGDVLLVDTTHTVKLGGDVNRIVLDLLPLLAPGVAVHFHDVFLPWEYPRGLVAQMGFWAEQYLLQAYLAENPRWEVLLGLHAVIRAHPDEARAVMPRWAASPAVPSSFWIRRLP